MAAAHIAGANRTSSRFGYPDRQEQVLDATAYYWGTASVESEYGPTCQVKAVAGTNNIIKDSSIFGDPLGCDLVLKQLR